MLKIYLSSFPPLIYSTSTGTVDFAPIDRTLTFSSEITEVNVTVMVVDDAVNEMREQFTANLQLITSDANVIINPNVTTIFIEDDDRKLICIIASPLAKNAIKELR